VRMNNEELMARAQCYVMLEVLMSTGKFRKDRGTSAQLVLLLASNVSFLIR